jgi:hypothetical protein
MGVPHELCHRLRSIAQDFMEDPKTEVYENAASRCPLVVSDCKRVLKSIADPLECIDAFDCIVEEIVSILDATFDGYPEGNWATVLQVLGEASSFVGPSHLLRLVYIHIQNPWKHRAAIRGCISTMEECLEGTVWAITDFYASTLRTERDFARWDKTLTYLVCSVLEEDENESASLIISMPMQGSKASKEFCRGVQDRIEEMKLCRVNEV